MKKTFAVTSLSFLLLACCVAKTPTPQNPVLANIPSNGGTVDKMDVSEDFVQGSEDIPLLVKMDKMFDESLGFDSASGSIMSSSYESKVDLEKVKSFYEKTLPQMGWKLVKSDVKNSAFEREKEKLEIEFSNQEKKKVVKFFISSTL